MQERVFVPELITVHLGPPDSDAPNVTVPFPDYIKNVASSELFPTWPENALRANIYAIVTFALNRLYTEWYKTRGYDFDITSSTQYDMAFIEGRDIFENISQLTDELFNSYITRDEYIEPIFSSFCDGRQVTCEGLSQWGSVDKARQGQYPYDILTDYFGNDINIATAPVETGTPSWNGIELEEGSSGNEVLTIQTQLNRISRNYPAIPKIPVLNGVYGKETADAVREFQRIINMPQTGTVNESDWYRIAYIYISVKRLAELDSEGLTLAEVTRRYPGELSIGASGEGVITLQYMLAVVGAYYESVQPLMLTGSYDEQTAESLRSFQQTYGLPQTGVLDRTTWNDLMRAYLAIAESIPIEASDLVLYPGKALSEGARGEYVRELQEYLSYINMSYSDIPAVSATGYFGPLTRASVIAFQKRFGLTQNGIVNAQTWNEIVREYSELKYGFEKQPYQYPGYVISRQQ